jgi:hypothetical protein
MDRRLIAPPYPIILSQEKLVWAINTQGLNVVSGGVMAIEVKTWLRSQ